MHYFYLRSGKHLRRGSEYEKINGKKTLLYEGEFRHGKRHGAGKSYVSEAGKGVMDYKGEFKFGKRDGEGTSWGINSTETEISRNFSNFPM